MIYLYKLPFKRKRYNIFCYLWPTHSPRLKIRLHSLTQELLRRTMLKYSYLKLFLFNNVKYLSLHLNAVLF